MFCWVVGLVAARLPHVFKTDHARYIKYYDEETKRIVEQVYAPDIAEFGYRFGDGA